MSRQAVVAIKLATPASVAAGAAVDVSAYEDTFHVLITPDNAGNTVALQQSPDGATWFAIAGITVAGVTANITATSGQALFRVPASARYVRANTTAYAADDPRIDLYLRPQS
jgi:hypothetical protein